MIKATIKETQRNTFAKAGAKRIARGTCETKATYNGLVLKSYKHLASGICCDKEIKNDLNNVILFAKQKEVA